MNDRLGSLEESFYQMHKQADNLQKQMNNYVAFLQNQEQEGATKHKLEYWSEEEHNRFLDAFLTYGKSNSNRIAQQLGTRNPKQISSHQQKFLKKLAQINYRTPRTVDRNCLFPLDMLISVINYLQLQNIAVDNPFSDFKFTRNCGVYVQIELPTISKQFFFTFTQALEVKQEFISHLI